MGPFRIAYTVLIVLFFGASVPAQQNFPITCPNEKTPHFPTPNATAIDSECGLAGSPAQPQPGEGPQNEAKNNFCAESANPAAITVAQLASLEKDAEKDPGYTPGEPPADRSFLKKLGEGDLVVFEGYVFHARQECKETVNCGTAVPNVNASHDIHIAMLQEPRKTKPSDPKTTQDTEECTGFVAEMIPHHRPAQWTACNVNDVANQGLKVRVTGQRFFDGSHVPCKDGAPQGSNPKRVSLWEIHPIYSFEVCPKGNGDCANGGWAPLEGFAPSTTCPEEKGCQQKGARSPNRKKKPTRN